MMSVAACWSRMSSRFTVLKKGGLAADSTMNSTTNGSRIPPRRSLVVSPAAAGQRALRDCGSGASMTSG